MKDKNTDEITYKFSFLDSTKPLEEQEEINVP